MRADLARPPLRWKAPASGTLIKVQPRSGGMGKGGTEVPGTEKRKMPSPLLADGTDHHSAGFRTNPATTAPKSSSVIKQIIPSEITQ